MITRADQWVDLRSAEAPQPLSSAALNWPSAAFNKLFPNAKNWVAFFCSQSSTSAGTSVVVPPSDRRPDILGFPFFSCPSTSDLRHTSSFICAGLSIPEHIHNVLPSCPTNKGGACPRRHCSSRGDHRGAEDCYHQCGLGAGCEPRS